MDKAVLRPRCPEPVPDGVSGNPFRRKKLAIFRQTFVQVRQRNAKLERAGVGIANGDQSHNYVIHAKTNLGWRFLGSGLIKPSWIRKAPSAKNKAAQGGLSF
jgi:hypothetical protein